MYKQEKPLRKRWNVTPGGVDDAVETVTALLVGEEWTVTAIVLWVMSPSEPTLLYSPAKRSLRAYRLALSRGNGTRTQYYRICFGRLPINVTTFVILHLDDKMINKSLRLAPEFNWFPMTLTPSSESTGSTVQGCSNTC